MRQIFVKIMVICLLVISVHSFSEGEYAPVSAANEASQTLVFTSETVQNDHLPQGDTQMDAECHFCHAAHVLLVIAPENFAFNIYSTPQFDGFAQDMLPSLIDDIAHPPIISI